MKADAVVCGAGIAGIAAAHALVRDTDLRRVVIVDEGPPLSLTSDKSTECYRNWWPGPGDDMVALSGRSITLMEALARETDNAIGMDRRGYLYLSARDEAAAQFDHRGLAAVDGNDDRIGYRGHATHEPQASLAACPRTRGGS